MFSVLQHNVYFFNSFDEIHDDVYKITFPMGSITANFHIFTGSKSELLTLSYIKPRFQDTGRRESLGSRLSFSFHGVMFRLLSE